MEPVGASIQREELALGDNAILDRKFSDGQVEVLFIAALQRGAEMDFWLPLSRHEIDGLFRDAVSQARPQWHKGRVEEEVERLRGILGRAIFYRLKANICHQASRSLQSTATDLVTIAGNINKIRAFKQVMESIPGGGECLHNLCGEKWDGSIFDLRHSLLDQAKRMNKLADGLHVEELLGREDPLRDMPELARRIYEQLPPGSFVREAFPHLLDSYQQRRESQKDALLMLKGACGAATSFLGGPGTVAGVVGKLYSAAAAGLDAGEATATFAGATARASAAFLSGGARADDYRRAISERDVRATADGIAIAISLGALAAGKLLPDTEKAALKLALSSTKASVTAAPAFDPLSGDGERLDRIIHRLAKSE